MSAMRGTKSPTELYATAGRTPAMAQFQEFHEAFNDSIKVATGSIVLAQTWSGTAATFADQFRDAVQKASSRWGRFCPKNFGTAADAARRDITRNGIVGVFAAFEVYLESLEDHAKARGGVRQKRSAGNGRWPWRNDLAHRRVAAAGLVVPELESRRALLAFFREVRNCVAHQRALADDRLTKIANSSKLKKAVEGWTERPRGRALPKLPTIREGDPVPLEPEHAILASSVCFELAGAIDRKLLSAYGS